MKKLLIIALFVSQPAFSQQTDFLKIKSTESVIWIIESRKLPG